MGTFPETNGPAGNGSTLPNFLALKRDRVAMEKIFGDNYLKKANYVRI